MITLLIKLPSGHTESFSIQQARELRDDLNQMLGAVTPPYYPRPIDTGTPFLPAPYYPDHTGDPYPQPYRIWCQAAQ